MTNEEQNLDPRQGTIDEHISGPLDIDEGIRGYLSETCKWGKFLAIIGFVSLGLMAIGGFAFSTMMSGRIPADPNMPFDFKWFGLIYLAIALIYLAPTLYLYRFSVKTGNALNSMDQFELREGFKNLKSLFKFMGMFMAIILGFYALMFVIAAIGGGLAAFG